MTTHIEETHTKIYVPSPFPQRKSKLKSRKTRYISVFLILLVIATMLAWQIFSGKEPVYIAVSGPMSGPSQPNGEAMVQGIQLYLDEVNHKGGIAGHPVKLLVYDDQNQAELATANALEIATQSQALAVIGHYSSKTSLAASPIYQEYGVPAITGSATADSITKDNKWYFRTIFNNSDQGALIANYVHKILGYEEASILYDEDAYGSTLKDAFTHTAKRIGLSIKHQWSFDSAEPTEVQKTLKQMVDDVKKSPEEAGMLFFAIHSTEALQAISGLRMQTLNQTSFRADVLGSIFPIIVADALSSSNFTQKLSEFPQERAKPGYYSDGIYTTSPLLFEIAYKKGQKFWYHFSKEYHTLPTITSAIYHDATIVIVNCIKKTLRAQRSKNLTETRKQIKNNLWRLSRLDNAIEGITGYLYFGENGDAIQSIPIGVYKNGKPTVALSQYQLATQWQNADSLLQDILDNKMILVNRKLMGEAKVVYVGIDFNDISEFNTQNSTFEADFYIWFRFSGDFNDKDIEFINILNPDKDILGKPIVESLSTENLTTRTYRVKAQFKANLDFHKYPLDSQTLPISFRHKTLTRDKLMYVVDTQGLNIKKIGNQSIKEKIKKVLSINGWKTQNVSFFQDIQISDSTLGIPELFNSQQRIVYSLLNANITIERNYWDVIFKKLLPPLLLVVLGYLSFFVPSSAFGTRLALGTFMIAATTPFYLNVTSELPKIDYTLLIEYFFYLIYLLAILTIAIAISVYIKNDNEDNDSKKLVKRLNFFGRWLYKVILVTGGATLAYTFM